MRITLEAFVNVYETNSGGYEIPTIYFTKEAAQASNTADAFAAAVPIYITFRDPNGMKCQHRGCKNPAQGYHCKSCNARVCKVHQEPDGAGNHGGLKKPFELVKDNNWRKIR